MEQGIYELSDKLNYVLNVNEDYKERERFTNMVSWAGDMIDLTIKERGIGKDVRPKKGEVWTCNLGENVGCELNKIRPVIITSNDIGNSSSPVITVVPITHKVEYLPTQVKLHPEDFSYTEKSITGTSLAEQIKVVSKARLGRKIGELNSTAMTKIELSILVSLGMIDDNV